MPQTCSNCQAQLPDDAANCPSCGAAAPTTAPSVPTLETQRAEVVERPDLSAVSPRDAELIAAARGTEVKKKRRFLHGANIARLIALIAVFLVAGWASLNGYGPAGVRQFYEDLMGRLSSGAPGGSVALTPATQILITNSLMEPVELLRDGVTERTIAPGEQAILPLSGNVGAVLSWSLIRPNGANGSPMGSPFSFELGARAESQSGLQYVITAATPGRRIFAPMVNNFSDRDVVILVSDGAGPGVRCNCLVPAGATRRRIGYYPLASGTTLRAYDATTPYSGNYEEITDLDRRADALSGSVEITLRGR